MRLELHEISMAYEDAGRKLQVIERLSYRFPEAGSVAVVGKSGVGKSTLLHLLAGLDSPDSGSIFLGDFEMSALSSDERAALRRTQVGFIFQFHHLLPEFSALENIACPLYIAGWVEREAHRRAEELLGQVGLEHRGHHRPGQLSGGEQQRVAIARALAVEPAVVFADEPTGNLDSETAAEVEEVLLRMQREQGNLLILVTHNMDLASDMDNVLEMLPGGGLRPWGDDS